MSRRRSIDERVRLDEKILLSIPETGQILSMGTQNAQKLATEAGAIVRVKSRIFVNREILQEYANDIAE